jgi:hypothetical protein
MILLIGQGCRLQSWISKLFPGQLFCKSKVSNMLLQKVTNKLAKSYKNINKLLKRVPVAKPDYETM